VGRGEKTESNEAHISTKGEWQIENGANGMAIKKYGK